MPQTPENFTREALSRAVYESSDLPLSTCRSIVSTTINEIIGALSRGKTAKFSGLATFKVETRGTRTYRNPQTGDYFESPPKKVVRVSVSDVLSDKVADLPVEDHEG